MQRGRQLPTCTVRSALPEPIPVYDSVLIALCCARWPWQTFAGQSGHRTRDRVRTHTCTRKNSSTQIPIGVPPRHSPIKYCEFQPSARTHNTQRRAAQSRSTATVGGVTVGLKPSSQIFRASLNESRYRPFASRNTFPSSAIVPHLTKARPARAPNAAQTAHEQPKNEAAAAPGRPSRRSAPAHRPTPPRCHSGDPRPPSPSADVIRSVAQDGI